MSCANGGNPGGGGRGYFVTVLLCHCATCGVCGAEWVKIGSTFLITKYMEMC